MTTVEPHIVRLYLSVVLTSWLAILPTWRAVAGEQATAREDTSGSRRVLVITGHQHPAHAWKEVTQALVAAAQRDKRLETAVDGIAVLGTPRLKDYHAVVMNYCNWEQPGISATAQENFQEYLSNGGGLVIIHFANGAFHFSLPGAEKSDWPQWRTKICRRVWDHTPGSSGHDPYGKFQVNIAPVDHPITRGLKSFETIDELYFQQQGTEPIEVLATARSKVTGQDEPMAFVYRYGTGRVFQTVLGHAAESIQVPSVAELICRAMVWSAGGEPRNGPVADTPAAADQSNVSPQRPFATGRLGPALDTARHFAAAGAKSEYARLPWTVECWARLDDAAGFNILVAQQPKESADHWELYSYAGNGELSLYLPGYRPAEIRSGRNVVDARWHHLAAQFDGRSAKLFVDGVLAREVAIRRARDDVRPGPLWIGAYPPQAIGCRGQIDSVRLSTGIRSIGAPPPELFESDQQTIGLWHVDALDTTGLADASRLDNRALLDDPWNPAAEPLRYQSADPRLRVVTIDRSTDESFLSLRLDTAGRLFVGGREALFVYEPAPEGGYRPRRELYRFPPDTWITDIEVRGDDLYLTTASALYVLPGARVRRQAIAPRRLIWGLPLDLHVTLHGLAWGPEGDLYFAAGDPLLNYGDFQRPDHWGHWTLFGPDGEQTPYTGSGGVFRCRPDGTSVRVVARGLRGCDGLAFDHGWNLFTNDNDHESLAAAYSPARLLHVTPEADFQWPRGWMPEKSPDRRDLLEPVYGGMLRGVPVGQAYYDESLLPEDLRHNLLVARWDNRSLCRYRLAPRGASFTASEHTLLVGEDSARPVGVAVGRGGRIFVAIASMQGNEGSPRYASELAMLVPADDPPTHPFEAYDVTSMSDAALVGELSSDGWSRRSAAHVEIQRRGGVTREACVDRAARIAPQDPAMVHLPWLLAAVHSRKADEYLEKFAKSPLPETRVQTARALTEFAPELSSDRLAEMLDAPQPRLQLAALSALFRSIDPIPRQVVAGPARSEDSYLRQAAAMLLARRGNVQLFTECCRDADPKVRLAGVLAAGFRLTVPPATEPIPAELPLRYDHGNASFVIRYADATIDLQQAGRVGSFTIAERWARLPHSAEEEQLVALLVQRLDDPDDIVRLQAAYFLSLLNDPVTEPLVKSTRRRTELARLEATSARPVTQAWFIGPFANDQLPPVLEGSVQGPIDLAAEYTSGNRRLSWKTVTASPEGAFEVPLLEVQTAAVSYLYCRLQTARPQRIRLDIAGTSATRIWHDGQSVPAAAACLLDLRPGSNDLLMRVAAEESPTSVTLSYRAVEPTAAVLPERLDLATLASRLQEASNSADKPVPAEFLTVDWTAAAAAGDAARGRVLFGAGGLGCVKCHAVTPEQVVSGGPSLAAAKNRFTVAHLVESILVPSRQVVPVFRATMISTHSGKIHTGLAISEDPQRVELLQADATRVSISKSDIDQRQLQPTSPMPSGLVRAPEELRDLLAYLLSENPPAP